MELPHVMDAYASDNVVLHMAAPATIDEREVKALLSALDVEVSSVTRDDAAAF